MECRKHTNKLKYSKSVYKVDEILWNITAKDILMHNETKNLKI